MALGLLIIAIFFPWRDLNRKTNLIGSMLFTIAALWILSHSLEISTPVEYFKAAMTGLQLFWGLLAITLWLTYIIQYCASGKWRINYLYILLGIMPLLVIAALVTNSIHGLLWATPGLNTTNPYLPLEPAYGPLYWVCMAYMGVLVIYGSLLVLRKVLRQSNFRSWKLWALIFAAVLPLSAAILEVTRVVQPAGLYLGITPFFSGIGVIILVWTLPRFNFQNMIPVTRNSVFEHMTDGVVVLDMQNRVMDLNPAAERLAGYTGTEALGLPVEQIWTNWPGRSDPSESASSAPREMILTRAGEQRTFDVHINTISDKNTLLSNRVAIMVDVTERKRVEIELLSMHSLFENSEMIGHVGGWEFNIDSKTQTWTEGTYRIHEVERTFVPSIENGVNFYTPESKPLIQRAVQRAIELGEPFDLELDIITAKGNPRNVRATGQTDLERRRVFGFFQDITHQKQFDKILTNKAKEWQDTFDSIPDLVSIQDKDHRLVRVNKAYAATFHKQPGELIGRHCYEVVHGTNEPVAGCPLGHVTHTGKSFTGELYEPSLGLDLEVSCSPILNEKQEVTDVVHYARNITERKRIEAENQHLRNKAEMSSRLAAIGEMAAGIAHEINNPLTGVIGFSEMLIDNQDLPEDINAQLKIIADGGHRVKSIVSRMLTFAHQIKPMKIIASINELIDATLELRGYVLRTANIKVIKQLNPELPCITVDPGQMQQVFLNIIVNAEFEMKKAHGKGTLTITTEKINDHIRILFKDDGRGISPEILAKLFNPFFTTKQVNEGTGLGLSMSRSIILEHDGTIEAESEPGKGATFIITLPITSTPEDESVKEVSSASVSSAKAKSGRILVVDDEVTIRALVKTILEKEGHDVDVTGDAIVAFEKLGSAHYEAIIMDIRMPGMSGMELYELAIQSHPELKTKFIFMTGDTSDAATRDFLGKNNLFYITKPFDRETLLQKVNAILF